jgi:hypothetical protein
LQFMPDRDTARGSEDLVEQVNHRNKYLSVTS